MQAERSPPKQQKRTAIFFYRVNVKNIVYLTLLPSPGNWFYLWTKQFHNIWHKSWIHVGGTLHEPVSTKPADVAAASELYVAGFAAHETVSMEDRYNR